MLGGVCVDCTASDDIDNGVKLEFDHVDPATKSFDIGKYISTMSMERLIEEAKKCELRCKPCHKARTKRLGHNRNKKLGIAFTEEELDNGIDDDEWEEMMGR